MVIRARHPFFNLLSLRLSRLGGLQTTKSRRPRRSVCTECDSCVFVFFASSCSSRLRGIQARQDNSDVDESRLIRAGRVELDATSGPPPPPTAATSSAPPSSSRPPTPPTAPSIHQRFVRGSRP